VTPVRRKLVSEAGMSATPSSADTRLTIVCIWIASCSTRGLNPAALQKLTTSSYSPGAIGRGNRMKGASFRLASASLPGALRQRVSIRQRCDQGLAHDTDRFAGRFSDRRQHEANVDAAAEQVAYLGSVVDSRRVRFTRGIAGGIPRRTTGRTL